MSVLRIPSIRHLRDFSLSDVVNELKAKAPTLMSVLNAAAGCTPQQHQSVIAMAAAVLLKQRNKHVCLLQSVIGCILYSGHSAKKVQLTYNHIWCEQHRDYVIMSSYRFTQGCQGLVFVLLT